jgi:hypothetical protein
MGINRMSNNEEQQEVYDEIRASKTGTIEPVARSYLKEANDANFQNASSANMDLRQEKRGQGVIEDIALIASPQIASDEELISNVDSGENPAQPKASMSSRTQQRYASQIAAQIMAPSPRDIQSDKRYISKSTI